MRRRKAKKKPATKKAVVRRKAKKKAQKKSPRVKRKKKVNIAARAKMAGVLCIQGDRITIVKRLTKEVQQAVDAGTLTAIVLKGPSLVEKGGRLTKITAQRFDAFTGALKATEEPAPAAAPAFEVKNDLVVPPANTAANTALEFSEEDEMRAVGHVDVVAPNIEPPLAQAAQGEQTH